MIGAKPLSTEVALHNAGLTIGGANFTSKMERLGLGIVGQDREGQLKTDFNKVKLVTEIWPYIDTSSNVTFDVYIGGQDTPSGDVTWNGPYTFDPQTTEKIDCLIEAKSIAIRFETDDPGAWRFDGYGLNIELVGEYF